MSEYTARQILDMIEANGGPDGQVSRDERPGGSLPAFA